MIRPLREQDREQLMQYIQVEPSLNIFIIGDVEKFGFDESFQELWGDFDAEGYFQGVLLRYRNNFVIYSAEIRSTREVTTTERIQGMRTISPAVARFI